MADGLTITIVEKGSSGTGAAGTNTVAKELKKQSKIREKELTVSTKGQKSSKGMFKSLLGIGALIAVLVDTLKPLLNLVKIIFAIVLLPILKYLMNVLGPILVVKSDEDKKNNKLKLGIKEKEDNIYGKPGSLGSIIKNIDKFAHNIGGNSNVQITNKGGNLSDYETYLDEEGENIRNGLIDFTSDLNSGFDTIVTGLKSVDVLFGKVWDEFIIELGTIWPDVLKPAWDTLVSELGTIWADLLKPAWDTLVSELDTIWTDFLKPVWDTLVAELGTIWTDFLKPAWDGLVTSLGTIWTDFLKPAWDELVISIESIWDIIKIPFEYIADKVGGLFGMKKKKEPEKAFGGTVGHDGMYKLHAGETVNTASSSGSSGNNITINISGSYDEQSLINKLTSELRRQSVW